MATPMMRCLGWWSELVSPTVSCKNVDASNDLWQSQMITVDIDCYCSAQSMQLPALLVCIVRMSQLEFIYACCGA